MPGNVCSGSDATARRPPLLLEAELGSGSGARLRRSRALAVGLAGDGVVAGAATRVTGLVTAALG